MKTQTTRVKTEWSTIGNNLSTAAPIFGCYLCDCPSHTSQWWHSSGRCLPPWRSNSLLGVLPDEREGRSRSGSRHFSPYAHRGDIYLTFSSNIHFSCWTSARRWNSSPTSSSDSSAGRWDWGLPAPDWRTEDVIREQHVIVLSRLWKHVIAIADVLFTTGFQKKGEL